MNLISNTKSFLTVSHVRLGPNSWRERAKGRLDGNCRAGAGKGGAQINEFRKGERECELSKKILKISGSTPAKKKNHRVWRKETGKHFQHKEPLRQRGKRGGLKGEKKGG